MILQIIEKNRRFITKFSQSFLFDLSYTFFGERKIVSDIFQGTRCSIKTEIVLNDLFFPLIKDLHHIDHL